MAAKISFGGIKPHLKPWGTVRAPVCVVPGPERSRPLKIDAKLQRTRSNPWKSIPGYDTVELDPLPQQTVINFQVRPCSIPQGMSTEPIHYPSLVTGFERNPQHAARAALNVRYTHRDWSKNCNDLYSESNKIRRNCKIVRSDAIRLMRETDEKTVVGQNDVKYRIEERITDTIFWRNELNTELKKIKDEAALLSEMKRNIAKLLQDIEAPMHIAQECLRLREGRLGVEKEFDVIEEKLLREVNNLRNSRHKINELNEILERQLSVLRKAQHDLEEDVVHKEQTMCIDKVCQELDNYSRGISYRGGIENSARTISTAETWIEASAARVEKSQVARAKSAQLRSDLNTVVIGVAVSVQDHYADTNLAFEEGTGILSDKMEKVKSHLDNVQEETVQLDKYCALLRKAIADKSNPLMVAQSRLEARCHREGLELCEDFAHRRLIVEIADIQDSIEKLYNKLRDSESKYHQLLKTRTNLRDDLKRKVINLFVDREKCIGLRRSFPINKMIKY